MARGTTATGPLPEPLVAFEDASAPMLAAIGGLDALQGRYLAAREAGRILPNVVEAIRIELTYHSNAIEGSTLTLRDTQLVIEGLAPSSGKSMRELYEARNHDRALRTVEAWAADRPGSAPITVQDILDVHAIVLADINPATAGRVRSERVLIAGTPFVPPGSHKFDELLRRMLDLANRSGVHAVLRAAELHYNLVAVHPFSDGNGRTARLIMNYSLLRHGFPHVVIEVSGREEYLAALDECNAGKWERFGVFVVASAECSIRKMLGDA